MKCYKIQDDVFLQKVVNETVILAPDSGNYFSLDEIGSRMVILFPHFANLQSREDQRIPLKKGIHKNLD